MSDLVLFLLLQHVLGNNSIVFLLGFLLQCHPKSTCGKKLDMTKNKCEYCQRNFLSRTELEHHERMHTGECLGKFSECNFTARTRWRLDKHREEFHNINPAANSSDFEEDLIEIVLDPGRSGAHDLEEVGNVGLLSMFGLTADCLLQDSGEDFLQRTTDPLVVPESSDIDSWNVFKELIENPGENAFTVKQESPENYGSSSADNRAVPVESPQNQTETSYENSLEPSTKDTFGDVQNSSPQISLVNSAATFENLLRTADWILGSKYGTGINENEQETKKAEIPRSGHEKSPAALSAVAQLNSESYSCPGCDIVFYCISTMERHAQERHGDKPFKCDQCRFSFKAWHNFNRHNEGKISGKLFKCSICDFTSCFKSGVYVHNGLAHKSESRPIGIRKESPAQITADIETESGHIGQAKRPFKIPRRNSTSVRVTGLFSKDVVIQPFPQETSTRQLSSSSKNVNIKSFPLKKQNAAGATKWSK